MGLFLLKLLFQNHSTSEEKFYYEVVTFKQINIDEELSLK